MPARRDKPNITAEPGKQEAFITRKFDALGAFNKTLRQVDINILKEAYDQ